MLDRVRLMVTSAAVILLGMCLGACVYESVVIAPNFSARVPESLVNARNFLVVSHGGTFFRVLSPVTQITLVLTVVLNWRVPRSRWWLVGAFVALAVTDVITFTFHYPRNAVLFQEPLTGVPVERLAAAARQWGTGNLVRAFLLACSAACAVSGLLRLARGSGGPEKRPT